MSGLVDENLLRDFVSDSTEHLGAIEPDLLAMEGGGDPDPEVINRIFRAVHSVKGFSVFLGFEKFTNLSHAMENVLMRVRDGALSPDPGLVDALLAGVDKLRLMLEDMHSSEQVEVNREMAALKDRLGVAEPSPGAGPAAGSPAGDPGRVVGKGGLRLGVAPGPGGAPVEFRVEAPALAEALEAGRHLFALGVDPARDLKDGVDGFRANLETVGGILAADLEPAAGGLGLCLLATVIEEPEIAALAVGVDEARMVPVSRETALAALAGGGAEPGAAGREGPDPAGGLLVELPASGPRDALSLTVPARELAEAREAGFSLYALWVEFPHDLSEEAPAGFLANLGSVGRVLAHDFAQPALNGFLHCLIVSLIQETEIAALAFELPADQVVRLEAGDTGAATEAASPPSAPPPALSGAQPPGPAPVPAARAPETIRVDINLVDGLINLAGELVLGRNQLTRIMDTAGAREPAAGRVLQTVDRVVSDLQEQIMQLRMQPVGNLFNKFPRLVRDLSRQLAKEVDLSISGGEVELDKAILEGLGDPLTHLIRNCVDHGLEDPRQRQEAGKPRAGRIELRAFHEEGLVNILVADDGRGMDPEAVGAMAVTKGLMSAEEVRRLGPDEKLHLITLPGLSTAREVTDVSGRGVGMDVVRNNIEKVGGHLQIESAPGAGTLMRLRLPLTLAIIPSLVVGCGGQVFAIPQMDVQELVSLQAGAAAPRIERVGEAPVLRLRQRLLPLVRLSDILKLEPRYTEAASGDIHQDRRDNLGDRRRPGRRPRPEPEGADRRRGDPDRRRRAGDMNVVVLKVGGNRYGLIVEKLFDTEEIVVKPLSRHLKEVKCFAGTTIMGDGRVAMILDSMGIAGWAGLKFSEIHAEEARLSRERERRQTDSAEREKQVVVFTCDARQRFAVPLSAISRLELIEPGQVELVGDRECVQYRGGALPLLRLERHLPVKPVDQGARELFLLVPREDPPRAGVVAARILDVISTGQKVRPYQGPHRGLMGVAPLLGHLTLFLDLEELLDEFIERF